MVDPYVGLHVYGVIPGEVTDDGRQGFRHVHRTAEVEGQARPLAPLIKTADDGHRPRSDSHNPRAGTDVNAEPRIDREPVVARPGNVVRHRDVGVLMFAVWAHGNYEA